MIARTQACHYLPVRGLALLLVTVALAGCGASAPTGAEPIRAEGPTQATVTAECPAALPTGRFASARLVPALRRAVPRLYSNLTNQDGGEAWRGFVLAGTLALGDQYPPGTAPRRLERRLHAVALRLCGHEVADRSWVAFVHLPNASNAAGLQAVYLARTHDGWRAWHARRLG